MSTKRCPKCGNLSPAYAYFCPNCGESFAVAPTQSELMVVTTSTIPGYEIVKALGTVHGMTVRTRGVGGKIMAGIEGMFGGEIVLRQKKLEKSQWKD